MSIHKLTTEEEKYTREHFQANMLDGDTVEDCGGSMLSAEHVFEYMIEHIATLKGKWVEEERRRLKNPCRVCNGEGFIMEYDDSPGYLVKNDCGKCKNSGIEPTLTPKD